MAHCTMYTWADWLHYSAVCFEYCHLNWWVNWSLFLFFYSFQINLCQIKLQWRCYWEQIQMSESEDLRDILYNELANLTIFMRLLKYAVARQKMIKCFSVSQRYHLNKLFLMCFNKQNWVNDDLFQNYNYFLAFLL